MTYVGLQAKGRFCFATSNKRDWKDPVAQIRVPHNTSNCAVYKPLSISRKQRRSSYAL